MTKNHMLSERLSESTKAWATNELRKANELREKAMLIRQNPIEFKKESDEYYNYVDLAKKIYISKNITLYQCAANLYADELEDESADICKSACDHIRHIKNC